jgi:hypothetical protein
MPHSPNWNPNFVPNLLQNNGIENRDQLTKMLAKIPGVSRATVYRHFDQDWVGTATLPLLAAMSQTFNVPLDKLTAPLGRVAPPRRPSGRR